jgi:hypothetical protein
MKHTRAIEVLANCERELRTLLAECASSGDYVGVLELTPLAQAVAELAGAPTASSASFDAALSEPAGTKADSLLQRSKPIDSKNSYPKFFRKGDELVKVGWSKRERREYHHRAPKIAVNAVGGALKRIGAKGRSFNGGDLLPLKNPEGASAIPNYQAYVALAWMKDLGIVKQRGRRAGYKLNDGTAIDSIVSAAWPKLTEWTD